MERLTLSNNEIHTDAGIWILKNGNPKELISNDCDEYEYFKKLAEYEDLEGQGRLLKLPCAVGDAVYVIPSETNYKLNIISEHSENNRVYEQIVNRIEISNTGYLLATCDGMASVVDTFYKKTWFLTKEAAEAALKEL